MGDAIRILYVDDNTTSLRFRARQLNGFDGLDVSTALDATEGLHRLATEEFDCVLSDLHLGERDGIEFLRAVRKIHPQLPFILFTTNQTNGAVEEAFNADVTDFVVKDGRSGSTAVLVNRIEHFVDHYRTKTVRASGSEKNV